MQSAVEAEGTGMEECSEEAEEVADALLAEVADDLAVAICFEVRCKIRREMALSQRLNLPYDAVTDAQSKSHAAADHAAAVGVVHVRGRCAAAFAFLVLWLVGGMTMIKCAETKAEPAAAAKPVVSKSPTVVDCPNCHTQVSAMRFAPHLEKCMNPAGRQGGGRSRAAKPASFAPTSSNATKPLVVRIRTRNGKPFQTFQRRVAETWPAR